ncbi:MAG: three-Cys-motif partner protein TcmP [Solirubrobacteraceae bacterium]
MTASAATYQRPPRLTAESLPAFLQASSGKSTEYIYLDAFAGEGHGIDRLTGEEFRGSSRIALEATATRGDAQFTRLRYFEQDSKARELETRLQVEYPGRDIRVYGGDCNAKIPEPLRDLWSYRWAPTFAFIDPDGMEFEWRRLEALAAHKRGYRAATSSKREYKVELWLLFPTQGIVRTLALDAAKVRPEDERRATELFDTEAWRAIYERRVAGKLSPHDAKEEYVNLMRWRLSEDLGYDRTHPLELKNTRGGTIYHMVFATDNAAGDRIMGDIYNKAASQMTQMRQEARDRKRGQATLDLGVAFETGDATYEYEPPWDPPAMP